MAKCHPAFNEKTMLLYTCYGLFKLSLLLKLSTLWNKAPLIASIRGAERSS